MGFEGCRVGLWCRWEADVVFVSVRFLEKWFWFWCSFLTEGGLTLCADLKVTVEVDEISSFSLGQWFSLREK